ncbi:hypothetical protein PSACC_02105 [Paramicrosporidium saccamoebae]|uniref:N-acetyltransferase domain-containing protein n=1 Tax=Paramicrosporidium saccamoebae TaxID=1246581 RepID=A0A2H9TK12_9FUNG|nr:hypothetical protein PSACC_02105 [Paramicrosporidium saccamoebae]
MTDIISAIPDSPTAKNNGLFHVGWTAFHGPLSVPSLLPMFSFYRSALEASHFVTSVIGSSALIVPFFLRYTGKAWRRDELVGVIIGKVGFHGTARRGYIGMLAVLGQCRGHGIGICLVGQLVEIMIKEGSDEIVLETEVTNLTALKLYAKLGFIREKRLPNYYLNGSDAFRLKLWTVKRFTSAHRAKVDKKMREHNRKVAKDAKSKGHKKGRKDPGIPSMLPGKEEFVRKMQEEREKEKMQRQIAIANNDLNSLARRAAVQAQEHTAVAKPEESGRFYDSSKRAFYREFKQVVDNADVILTVLDARDPLGCRVRAVEEMVAATGGRKRIVFVLNKIDLVPREIVAQWLAVLRREHPAVAFKASTQTQRTNLGSISAGEKIAGALTSSECLGADTLIQLLKNYCRSLNIKTSIRVGVVGYPNVGKSSLINSLKRAKVCKVGATPGVTTVTQEINLDRNIKLLDCPGIVFATPSDSSETAHLFLRNCLKVEQLEDPVAPIELILKRAAPEQLMYLYAIPRFSDTNEFLCHIARRQGKLKKGGIPNVDAAAKSVLIDWNQGKIPFYTLPPAIPSTANNAVIVGSWAPEFDLESLVKMEVDTVLANVAEELAGLQPIVMDVAAEAPQLVVAASTSKGKSSSDDGYEIKMSVAELENNPQANRNRQKQLKQAKKAAQKRTAKPTDMMEIEDAYDFATDFQQ